MDQQVNVVHPSSAGHILAGVSWLDAHFAACRREYEAALRAAGIQPGWRVLDAACGSGSFLPELGRLVGSAGAVVALDYAPENVAAVVARLPAWELACAASPLVGTIAALPFADDSFDAVWCANVLQYFDAAETLAMLAELRRVVRPGGLVAVKDVDMLLWRIAPASPFLIGHLSEASIAHPPTAVQSRGSIRGRELRRWLERAGLADVRQQTTLIERWAPLRTEERQFWVQWLVYLAEAAGGCGVPGEDQATWVAVRDPGTNPHLVDDPEFYCCEGMVTAVGMVPAT